MQWNNNVKVIFSDVDETIAEVYTPAEPEMIKALNQVLSEKRLLCMVTGGGLASLQERIISFIRPELRKYIILAVCSGAEVWGFDEKGDVLEKPYYSLYDQKLSQEKKDKFREILEQVINEFELVKFSTMGDKKTFREKTQHDPHSIMFSDRGPQITFQLTNAYDLTAEQAEELNVPKNNGQFDMRYPVMERANALFVEHNIPITGRVAGTTALDFAVEGISKTTAVEWIFNSNEILSAIGMQTQELLEQPEYIEIWGDKFSTIHGGTDRHMCEALPKEVRAIDFREEKPEEFLPEYNIQVWDGQLHLHHGLLEYLQKVS